MSQTLTRGAHHIGLSVIDLETSVHFFCVTLGFSEVGGNPAYPSKFVSDGVTLITLWQIDDPKIATRFDRKTNVGLHHLALGVADEAALDTVFDRVKEHPGAKIEFAPEPISEGSAVKHFICNMPDGIRIEFATPFS